MAVDVKVVAVVVTTVSSTLLNFAVNINLNIFPDSNYYRNDSGRGGPSGGNGNFMPNNNSNMGGNNPNAWGGGNNSNNNRNLDMPNLQALGINPGGNQNQGSNMNNPPMGRLKQKMIKILIFLIKLFNFQALD